MKSYPSIEGGIVRGAPLYIFDKLDGSNVRAEWSRKRGFYKFGRRNGLLDDTNPLLKAKTEPLIRAQEDAFNRIFRAQRWDKVVIFFEFHGPNSFAGSHDEADDHRVTLIDVSVHRKGILPPKDFIKLFADEVETAPLLHRGNFTVPFQEEVETGTLEGMTFEGVIAKGPNVSPGRPLMFKRKNVAWLQKLRAICADDAEFKRRS